MASSAFAQPGSHLQGTLLSRKSSRRAHPSSCGQRLVVRATADNQLLKKPDFKKAVTESVIDMASQRDMSGSVTVEYQRQRAKEMRQYFVELRNDELRGKSQVFGWTPKNEIGNGRWVMFGLLVGLLTEYATGVDFVNQLKLMVSYLGIVDLD